MLDLVPLKVGSDLINLFEYMIVDEQYKSQHFYRGKKQLKNEYIFCVIMNQWNRSESIKSIYIYKS